MNVALYCLYRRTWVLGSERPLVVIVIVCCATKHHQSATEIFATTLKLALISPPSPASLELVAWYIQWCPRLAMVLVEGEVLLLVEGMAVVVGYQALRLSDLKKWRSTKRKPVKKVWIIKTFFTHQQRQFHSTENKTTTVVSKETAEQQQGPVVAKGLRAERATHPGQPDKPRHKRSSEEVAAERQEKFRRVEEAQQRREQAVEEAAREEDAMAREDKSLASSNGAPPADLPERQRRARPKPQPAPPKVQNG